MIRNAGLAIAFSFAGVGAPEHVPAGQPITFEYRGQLFEKWIRPEVEDHRYLCVHWFGDDGRGARVRADVWVAREDGSCHPMP